MACYRSQTLAMRCLFTTLLISYTFTKQLNISTYNKQAVDWLAPLQDGLEVRVINSARIVTGIWTVIITLQEPQLPEEFFTFVRSTRDYISIVPESIGQSGKFGNYVKIWRRRLQVVTESLRNPHPWWRYAKEDTTYKDKRLLSTRRRRGLINIIGKGLSFLFGVSTEDEVKDIHKSINELAVNQQKISHDIDKFSSILNHTYDEIIANRKAINHLASNLENFQLSVNDALHTLGSAISQVQFFQQAELLVSEIERFSQQFLQQHNHWHSRKESLELGRLSEHLLPPDVLAEILNTHRPTASEFISPIEWYYSEVRLTPMWSDQLLVFKADLPLVSKIPWSLVSFVSWPHPLGNRFASIDLPARVVRDTSSSLMVINPVCVGDRPKVCYTGSRRDVKSMPCVQSLLQLPPEYHDKCQLRIFSDLRDAIPDVDSIPDSSPAVRRQDALVMRAINEYTLITNGTVLTLRCQGKSPVRRTVPPGVYILMLNYPCIIATNGWTLASTPVRAKNFTYSIKNTLMLPMNSFINNATYFFSININRINVSQIDEVKRQTFQRTSLTNVDMYNDDNTSIFTIITAMILIILIAYACFRVVKLYRSYHKCCHCFKKREKESLELTVIKPDTDQEKASVTVHDHSANQPVLFKVGEALVSTATTSV